VSCGSNRLFIIGDALFACGPVMKLCRRNCWDFVLTFKEGVMPKVYASVHAVRMHVEKSGYGRGCDFLK